MTSSVCPIFQSRFLEPTLDQVFSMSLGKSWFFHSVMSHVSHEDDHFFIQKLSGVGMVMQAFNLSPLEAETGRVCEFKVSLSHILIPCVKKQTKFSDGTQCSIIAPVLLNVM